MGKLWDSLGTDVAGIFSGIWTTRDGQGVPEPEDLLLGSNDGVKLDAAVLYADLAESTSLVDAMKAEFAAEVYKAYLHCAGKIIRGEGGKIVSFDGDRIMAIFLGDSKNSSAARAALKINGAVINLINPALKKQYGVDAYQVAQAVGIDTSSILAARTGVRGDNDIVWVGRAANYAAKLCSYRSGAYKSIVTSAVYDALDASVKFDEATGNSMWVQLSSTCNGVNLYGSSWFTYNF